MAIDLVRKVNVILIGFMATGKSTIGRALGRKLDLPTLDMDHELRKQFGMTVPKVFEAYGEAAFRQAESDFLASLIQEQSTEYEAPRRYPRSYVLSTGGGVPLIESNRSMLTEIGNVVWLRAQPETIAARCRPHVERRPILNGHTDDLDEHIRRLLAEREPSYDRAACIQVWTDDNIGADGIALRIKNEIASLIKKRGQ